MSQLDIRFGEKLRDAGIAQAVDHADQELTGWIDYAYRHFEDYLRKQPIGFTFMIEDFREYLKKHLVSPPSLRAFGAIPVRGVRNGRIENAGYAKVKNVKAHRTPAAIWRRVS